jgi:carboxymethylenebutenolidase
MADSTDNRPAFEGIVAETVVIRGHNDDAIPAYLARPSGPGPFPGIVYLHHGLGWDEWCKEQCLKFASHGYAAINPNLDYRAGPGDPEDVAVKVRSEGWFPDDQVLGDIASALSYLRTQPFSSGKVGVIGPCSGGRYTFLSACRITGFDAAVDLWGGSVVVDKPEDLTSRRPVAPVDYTSGLSCPLLGLFGNDDPNPTPAHVNRMEAELQRLGKDYEFHRYDGAGHGFFYDNRPSYRQEQAMDGWAHVWRFFDTHLREAAVPAGAR